MGKIIRNGIEYSGTYDDANSVNYDNSLSGLDARTVQESIDKLNDSLVNENGETFKYGYQDGKRGVWVKEADTDVFVPFKSSSSFSSELVEFLNILETRLPAESIDTYKEQYNFVDLLSDPVTSGDYTLTDAISDYEYIILYCMYKGNTSSQYNCAEIIDRKAIIYGKDYYSNPKDKNQVYRKCVKFIDETNVNVTPYNNNNSANSTLRILGVL